MGQETSTSISRNGSDSFPFTWERSSPEVNRNCSTWHDFSAAWQKLWISPGVKRRNPKVNNVCKQIRCEVMWDEKSPETTPLIWAFPELFKHQLLHLHESCISGKLLRQHHTATKWLPQPWHHFEYTQPNSLKIWQLIEIWLLVITGMKAKKGKV